MKKRWLLVTALSVLAYGVLMCLLVYAESFSDSASIRTIGDAIWFSLVTLTTVGYGDFFPVTAAGRVIGVLFLLLSTGFLTLLIGAALSLMLNQIFPKLRLRCLRRSRWYIFSELNPESAALALNLAAEAPKAAYVFMTGQKDSEGLLSAMPGHNCFRFKGTTDELLRLKMEHEGIFVFFMGGDGYENYRAGQAMCGQGLHLYCQTALTPDVKAPDMTLFDRYDCCARLLWQRLPASAAEHKIVLIGSGKYSEPILERGLLTSVFSPEQHIEYHVLGEHAGFINNHQGLGTAVNIGQSDAPGDCLIYHTGAWNEDGALLESADRIILCSDSDGENLEYLQQLRRYFAVSGKVCLRLAHPMEGTLTFGTDRDIFTPELVMHTRLDRTAVAMHEIYSRSMGESTPKWAQLSEFARQSNIAAADHLPVKLRLLLCDDSVREIDSDLCRKAYARYLETMPACAVLYRQIEHERWMRFHAMYNWRYSPERDNAARRHPAMLPFEELTEKEQMKDDFAWELLGVLAQEKQM